MQKLGTPKIGDSWPFPTRLKQPNEPQTGRPTAEIKEYHPHRYDDYKQKPGDFSRFCLSNGKATRFPKMFFHICLRNEHVGHAQSSRPQI